MQILASALPGFRDLRAPVIAGYLWLVFGWLLVKPSLDERPTSDQLAAAVYDLGQDVGRLGLAIAASVAAYLLGAVSQEISAGLRRGWGRSTIIPPQLRGLFRYPGSEEIQQLARRADAEIRRSAPTREAVDRALHQLQRRLDDANEEATQELSLPATLLVGDQPELFAEVDRLRAEGELRLAVVPPLLALTVLLALEDSAVWLLLLPAILLLFVQGVRRNGDSRKIIADAILLGRVHSSSVRRFSEWVDGLSERVSKM